MRMRARRAERCLQRAASAIDTGGLSDARDALDEARSLIPSDPRITELAGKLQAVGQPAVIPLANAPGVEPDVYDVIPLSAVREPAPPPTERPSYEPAFQSAVEFDPGSVEFDPEIDPDAIPYALTPPQPALASEIELEEVQEPEIPRTHFGFAPILDFESEVLDESVPFNASPIPAPAAESDLELGEVRELEPEIAHVGAFEPMLDLDRMRTPGLQGWSGVALDPPPRERNRATGVLAFGLLLSALVGWQAWAHKDEWISPFLPSTQPDVDSNIGLATSPSRPAAAAPAVVNDTPSPTPTVAPVQPDPQPAEEGASPTTRREEGSEPVARALGTAGDAASAKPDRAAVVRASEPEEPALPPRRDTVSPSATPGDTSVRRPESPATSPANENRVAPSSTGTTATNTTPATTPPPAATSAPITNVPSVAAPVDASPARTEPAPPLPSPAPSLPYPPATAPTPSPATASPASTASAAVSDQSAAIRAALTRYEAAYNRLDVGAVHSVWPSLDQHALSRAFEGLASQKVSLGTCSVSVNGSAARADCSGTAAWRPKVGGSDRRASRTWTFDLTESGGAWKIVRVEAR